MDKIFRRWAAGLLAAVLAALLLCAAAVYIIDPCLYYRMPERWLPVFFDERYQTAGLVKHIPADTVLMGSSMVANIQASWLEEDFGGTVLRVTIPDGYFSEFDQAMGLLFRSQAPGRVVFSLDLNLLTRDESGNTGAMPGYLYDENPLNDLKYLLNKDSLYYSLYVLLANRRGGGQAVDEGFVWNDGTVWARYESLLNYERPPQAAEALPEDAYLENTDQNLAVIEGWILAHPDVEFDVYFSPYSILFWDRCIRQGDLDARLAALERACEALMAHDNVRLYAPLLDRELITDLDNYCDYIHVSGEAGRQALEGLAAGEYRLTAENAARALADWREFVVNYDYESLWDSGFWSYWISIYGELPDWWDGETPLL